MTVLQSLSGYYGRMVDRGEAVPWGYSSESISVVVVLGVDGSVAQMVPWTSNDGKRPRIVAMPKWFTRSGTGATPFTFWDNSGYALGISKKGPRKSQLYHAAFKAHHARILANVEDTGLIAFRRFLERWIPAHAQALDWQDRYIDRNVCFQIKGRYDLIHECGEARAIIERLSKPKEAGLAVTCLVTGEQAAPARLHPKIKGVRGTASAEVPLVSFNENAFESYGKVQSYNAPTSEPAAFRYAAALNGLLGRRDNWVEIGDSTTVFWADASAGGEASARAAETLFATGIGVPSVDEEKAAKAHNALAKIAEDRSVTDFAPDLHPSTLLHVLGLSPNAARLSVRFWLTDTLEAFACSLARHAADLALEPAPWDTLPAPQWLLIKTTAFQEKSENISPMLAGELTRAILTGAPYPRAWLAATIQRLRAGDPAWTGWHAAAAKACINRLGSEEDLTVRLDPHSKSPAYQLGRLLAVLDKAQYAALGRIRASITVRHYGLASVNPAIAFGPLLRRVQHHLSDLAKRNAEWADNLRIDMEQIIATLGDHLPAALRLEDQGRFAVGYYHQRAHKREDEREATATDTDEETIR